MVRNGLTMSLRYSTRTTKEEAKSLGVIMLSSASKGARSQEIHTLPSVIRWPVIATESTIDSRMASIRPGNRTAQRK